MAIPEGVQAPKDEPIEGTVPELTVVPNEEGTEGVRKEEGEPLSGTIKEYDEGKAPSEERMQEMEEAKENAVQEGFDNYAKEADADKDKEKISWLRRILGGGGK